MFYLIIIALFFGIVEAAEPEQSAPIPTVSLTISSLKTHELVSITGQKDLPSSTIFQRGNQWLIIWSAPLNITIPDEFVGVQSIDYEQQKGMTILTFGFDHPISLSADPTPTGLELKFGLKEPAAEVQATQVMLPQKEGDPITIPYAEGDEILDYTDDKGDTYWVIPSYSKRKTPFKPYDFVDGVVLRSLCGLAIYARRSDLLVEATENTVYISVEEGKLSASTKEQVERLQQAISMPSLFDKFDAIKAQRRREEIDELLKKRPVMTAIPQVLELAWLHLGLGNVPEALANLRGVIVHRSHLAEHPYYKALLGLANLMAHKYDETIAALKVFASHPETEFWITLATLLSSGNQPEKRKEMLLNIITMQPVLRTLPQAVRERLLGLILSIGYALKNKELLTAFVIPDLKPKDPARLTLYQLAKASLLFTQEKTKDALKIIDALIKQKANAQISVMAEFELLQYNLKNKGITYEQALPLLESMRYKWRGDQFEYRVTRFLANLYWEHKDYPNSLKLYRKLIEYFPEDSQGDRLADLMQEGVMNYFKQPPPPPILEALSFFQEYADVAPDTIEGDDMIIAATNRLVDLKLTFEAIRLLRQYMKHKIKKGGEQVVRAQRFLYHIAVLEINAHKPERAVKDLLSVKEWDPSLKEKAHQLLCRAFVEAGQFDEALARLDSTPRDQVIVGELYMSKKEWAKAIETYEKLLTHMSDDAELTLKAKAIVNLAVCYTTTNNKEALKKMDGLYTRFMAIRPERELFNFLVNDWTKDLETVDAATLAKIDSMINTLKNVLQKEEGKTP